MHDTPCPLAGGIHHEQDADDLFFILAHAHLGLDWVLNVAISMLFVADTRATKGQLAPSRAHTHLPPLRSVPDIFTIDQSNSDETSYSPVTEIVSNKCYLAV